MSFSSHATHALIRASDNCSRNRASDAHASTHARERSHMPIAAAYTSASTSECARIGHNERGNARRVATKMRAAGAHENENCTFEDSARVANANSSARGASWRAAHRAEFAQSVAEAHEATASATVIDFLVNDYALLGQRKWLGAAVTSTGDIYGVPSHARKVLHVDPRNGTMELIGSELTMTHFKFLRGVDGKNGHCYGLPAWGEGVLKIDVETGETSMIGVGLYKQMKWQWHGGSLGSDGALYAVPCNASSVLRVCTKTEQVSFIGEDVIPKMRNKWYGGIKASDGSIYGVPYCANSIIRIVPETQSVELLELKGAKLERDTYAWHGGILAPNGCIYCFPSHHERVMKIDTATRECTLIGRSLGEKRYKFGGGCVGPNGDAVYAFPSDYHAVLKIDTTTDEVSLVGEGLPGMLPDLLNKWQNGVLAPDGYIYGVPCDAPSVLQIDPRADSCNFLGSLGDLPDKYQGGFLDKNSGVVYCVPENAENVLRICPPGSTPNPPARDGAAHDAKPRRASPPDASDDP